MNGPQLPHYWKDPGNWRIRDFEMMGEIMNDANERMARHLRRLGRRGWHITGYDHGDHPMIDYSHGQMGPGSGMRPRQSPFAWSGSSDNDPVLQQIRLIASEHDRRINQMRDFMGISDDAMRERAYRQRQRELWEGIQRMELDAIGPGPGMGNPMLGRNPPVEHQGGRRRWQPGPMNDIDENDWDFYYGR